MSDVQSKPVTPAKATKAEKKASPTKPETVNRGDLPESVKLAAPHGFYDEAGDLQAWLQGETVTSPEDIALLIDRGARLYGIGDEPAETEKAA